MTTATLTHEISPSRAREDMHMDADTFSLASPVLSPHNAPEACRDRGALLARFWSRPRRAPRAPRPLAHVRQHRAAELRQAGWTYAEIARQVGYCDATSAWRAIRAYHARDAAQRRVATMASEVAA